MLEVVGFWLAVKYVTVNKLMMAAKNLATAVWGFAVWRIQARLAQAQRSFMNFVACRHQSGLFGSCTMKWILSRMRILPGGIWPRTQW